MEKGGSVRIPAAFNFLYGLRPSHGRVPYAGAANSMAGQETVHSVIGPISHSMADMRLFMTSLLAQEPWHYDSKVLPIPWRQSEEDAAKAKIESKGLTLGFFSSDEYVSATLASTIFCLTLFRAGISPSTRDSRSGTGRLCCKSGRAYCGALEAV